MNVREKLAKLVEYMDGVCPSGISCYNCPHKGIGEGCSIQAKVDYLIKGGITVQEWTSVKDRLPDYDGCYIVTACDEGCPSDERIWDDTVVVVAEYYDDGRWVWYEGITEYDLCDIVTHWMPLPQPPKGE